jgi:hypothetical protein
MLTRLDDREIDRHPEGPVEQVGEDVHRDVSHDVTELGVGEARRARCLEVAVADIARRAQDGLGEGEDRRRFGIRGLEPSPAVELVVALAVVDLGQVARQRARSRPEGSPAHPVSSARRSRGRIGLRHSHGA